MNNVSNFLYGVINWFKPDEKRFSCFNWLPFDVQTQIVSSNYLVDTFSFMEVSTECYLIGRVSVIKKAQSWGYSKSENIENFEDATGYLNRFFFRVGREQQRDNSGNLSDFRSTKDAIENEIELFQPPEQKLKEGEILTPDQQNHQKIKDKLKFIEKLSVRPHDAFYSVFRKLPQDEYLIHLNIKKDYINYFLSHFFDFTIPQEIYEKFSFTLEPQFFCKKFEALIIFTSLAANKKDICIQAIDRHIDAMTTKERENGLDEWYYFENLKDTEGNNLLHIGAFVGATEIVERLCTAKTQKFYNCLHSKNKEGKTPLDMALSKGHTDMIDLLKSPLDLLDLINPNSLLKYLKKTNGGNLLFEYVSKADNQKLLNKASTVARGLIQLKKHYTLKHKAFKPISDAVRSLYVHQAVKSNCVKLLKAWSSSTSLQYINDQEQTLLEVAAQAGSFASLHRLIFLGHNLQDETVMSSVFNVLIESDIEKNRNAMRCLVRSGANLSKFVLDKGSFYFDYFENVHLAINLLNEGNVKELREALVHSFSDGLLDGVFRLALQGSAHALDFVKAGMIQIEKEGVSFLHTMINDFRLAKCDLSDTPLAMRDLIKHWISDLKDVDEDRTYSKKTLMANAVYSGCFQIVQMLLDKGWGVDRPDDDGFTPLHWAIQRNSQTMLSFVLKQNVRVTPDFLFFAYSKKRPLMAILLAEKLEI